MVLFFCFQLCIFTMSLNKTMSLKKGHKKVGGRVAGTPNKLPQTIREVFSNVNLKAWAKANPTDFYKLSIKLISLEMAASIDNKQVQLVISGDSEEHKKGLKGIYNKNRKEHKPKNKKL